MKKVLAILIIALLAVCPLNADVEKQGFFSKAWSHVPFIGGKSLSEHEDPLPNGNTVRFSKKETLAIVSMEPESAYKYVEGRKRVEAPAVYVSDILKEGKEASEFVPPVEDDIIKPREDSSNLNSMVVAGAIILGAFLIPSALVFFIVLYLLVKANLKIRDMKHEIELVILTKK